MQRLAKKVQELAERIYQVEPVVAHLHHEKGQFIDFTNQIQRIAQVENRNLLINALSETGVDISSTAIEGFFSCSQPKSSNKIQKYSGDWG